MQPFTASKYKGSLVQNILIIWAAWIFLYHQEQGSPYTILAGEVLDQAALMGVLDSLYSMRFPILRDCVPANRIGEPSF